MSLRLNYNQDRNNSQIFCLTLGESLSATTSGRTFYIKFENDQTLSDYAGVFENHTTYPDRYDIFHISTETGLTFTVSGMTNIPFPVDGWYSYSAYVHSGKTSALETGKAFLVDNNTITGSTYIETPEPTEYIYKN